MSHQRCSPDNTISPGLEGDFIRKIRVLQATSGVSGVAENVILPRCRDQARFTRHFNWLDEIVGCWGLHPSSGII